MSVRALKFAFVFAFIVNIQERVKEYKPYKPKIFGGSTAVAPQDTDDTIIYVA